MNERHKSMRIIGGRDSCDSPLVGFRGSCLDHRGHSIPSIISARIEMNADAFYVLTVERAKVTGEGGAVEEQIIEDGKGATYTERYIVSSLFVEGWLAEPPE